jgi:hypothetical protein
MKKGTKSKRYKNSLKRRGKKSKGYKNHILSRKEKERRKIKGSKALNERS